MSEKNEDQQKKYDIQFLSLVHGLSMSAMQQLGKVMNPVTQEVERNLDAARVTIDILEMIQAKTSGNLNQQEENILQEMLTNLRLNYVDESEKPTEKNDEKKPEEPTVKEEQDNK